MAPEDGWTLIDWRVLEEMLLDLALLVAPLVLYVLVRRHLLAPPADPRRTQYSHPGWNYPLKRMWAWLALKRQPKLSLPPSDQRNINFMASEYETRLEKPRKILRDKSVDSMTLYGVDQAGNCLVARIVRRFHKQAEVWLHLALQDGTVYQLTEHPATMVSTAHTKEFNAGGLKFFQIEPMRKWRIIFNGTMRKGVANTWDSSPLDEGSMEHVRLNFIWSASSSPMDVKESWSTKLLCEALAREPWRSGNWISVVSLEPPGYDQFGVMDGLIRVGDQGEIEGLRLYLRGGRERRWGEAAEENLLREVKLQGVAENGTCFTLRASCRQDGLTQAMWGLVRMSTGALRPVTSCHINLPELAHHKVIPKQLLVLFSAGGHNYRASIQFLERQGATLYSGHPWRYRGRCPVPHLQTVGTLMAHQWEVRDGPQPLVCTFEEPAAQVEPLTGGKGASLALLTSVHNKNFHVPGGFCVTTRAYSRHVASSSILQAVILNLKEIVTGQKDGELKTACEKVMQLLENMELASDLKASIERHLKKFSADTLFGVRSSAVGEDSEEVSCAGQNLTLLGVKSSGVYAALSRCWASLFSENSIQYRKQNGMELDPNMAVVIQEMVPAESAGVMFTRHPFSGNPRKLLITANYGLGESVVSAVSEPDEIVIARGLDDRALRIQKITLGSKNESIYLKNEEGGTETNEPTSEAKSRLCVSEDQLIILAEIGVQLEHMFGSPRDIEWAIAQDKVYLLQARPITALDAWTDFELEHELDSPVMTDCEVLTFANTGEVLPGATKPLTQSLLVRLLDHNIQRQSSGRHKERVTSPEYQNTVGSTSFHCLIYVLNTMLSNCEPEVTVYTKVMDLAIFGRLVTNKQMHRFGLERYGVVKGMRKFYMLLDMLVDTMRANKTEKTTRQKIKSLTLRADDHTSPARLLEAINAKVPILAEACSSHGHMSRVSIFTQVAAMSVLTEGKDDWTTDHYTDVSLILSSCTGVESAEIPTQLRELALLIKDKDTDIFCNSSPEQALNWLHTEPTVAHKFRAFLHSHGHRSIKELELHTLTWGMQPEGLVETLQALVKSAHSAPDQSLSLSVPETCAILKSPTKGGTKRALRFILPYCRSAVARREKSKSALISAIQTFRLGYRRLAQLLVREGRLPEPDLLFFLTLAEVTRIVQQPEPALLAKASKRRRLWNTWESLKFPEIILGVPKPFQLNDMEGMESTQKLMGTPVCSGVVLGRACVITMLSQTSEITRGDVLITHCTDIGWSPFFPLLSGIVTELGGLISHGAVVAREYGLPCIVGASNATHLFKTGDLVRLNGGTGLLEKISEKLETE